MKSVLNFGDSHNMGPSIQLPSSPDFIGPVLIECPPGVKMASAGELAFPWGTKMRTNKSIVDAFSGVRSAIEIIKQARKRRVFQKLQSVQVSLRRRHSSSKLTPESRQREALGKELSRKREG